MLTEVDVKSAGYNTQNTNGCEMQFSKVCVYIKMFLGLSRSAKYS